MLRICAPTLQMNHYPQHIKTICNIYHENYKLSLHHQNEEIQNSYCNFTLLYLIYSVAVVSKKTHHGVCVVQIACGELFIIQIILANYWLILNSDFLKRSRRECSSHQSSTQEWMLTFLAFFYFVNKSISLASEQGCYNAINNNIKQATYVIANSLSPGTTCARAVLEMQLRQNTVAMECKSITSMPL